MNGLKHGGCMDESVGGWVVVWMDGYMNE